MQLNDKFMMALIYAHGGDVIDRIEREAVDNARLRWLLGGIHFGPDEPLLATATRRSPNSRRWRRDAAARQTPKQPLDCEAMSLAELARAWVAQYSKSDRDRDDNFFAMMDYEGELREEDPDKAIDLIVAILKIETNPALLSLLAAGPLEDVISMETIDRIEREAARRQALSPSARRRLVLSRVRRTEGAARCPGLVMSGGNLNACRQSAQAHPNSAPISAHTCDASRLNLHDFASTFFQGSGWIRRAWRLDHGIRVRRTRAAASRHALPSCSAAMARRFQAQHGGDSRPSRL